MMVCVMYFGSPDVTIYNVFICNITRKHLSLRNFYIYSSKYTHYSVNHVSRLVPWRKIYLNTKWIFFHLESDFKKSFFNLIFYHKHLGFALYMAFWVNHFLFHASLPYIFQRAIFNTTPNPISRFHRQNELLGFKLDFYFIVAFCSRRGNQNFEFFSICYYTNSSMKKLWELISVCDVLVDWVTISIEIF